MKYFKIFAILLCSSFLFLYGCNDKSKTPEEDVVKQVEVPETTNKTEATKPNPATKEPAQNASGVWHYTCRIGCPGGAGTAVKCGNCGNVLTHNTTYHAKTNSTTTSAPFATPSTNAATPPEPAQNAAGVWHYTCSKGHAGGAGSAVACSTCSTTLTHNSAYH